MMHPSTITNYFLTSSIAPDMWFLVWVSYSQHHAFHRWFVFQLIAWGLCLMINSESHLHCWMCANIVHHRCTLRPVWMGLTFLENFSVMNSLWLLLQSLVLLVGSLFIVYPSFQKVLRSSQVPMHAKMKLPLKLLKDSINFHSFY